MTCLRTASRIDKKLGKLLRRLAHGASGFRHGDCIGERVLGWRVRHAIDDEPIDGKPHLFFDRLAERQRFPEHEALGERHDDDGRAPGRNQLGFEPRAEVVNGPAAGELAALPGDFEPRHAVPVAGMSKTTRLPGCSATT